MCTTTCESFNAIILTFYSMLLVGQQRVFQLVKYLNFNKNLKIVLAGVPGVALPGAHIVHPIVIKC